MNTSTTDLPPNETAPRIELAVSMESESHFFLSPDASVASGGVFIATSRDFAIGQSVRVELALHSYVLFFRGTVRWRLASGVGVGFDDISGPARRVIESFCARRRPAAAYDAEGAALVRH